MTLPAHHHLDRLAIPYQTLEFPPSTEKGASNVARALGCRESQMVKTLVFELDIGEKVLVMLGGGDKNAVSGHLKKAVGSRNVRLAAPETVKSVTGYEIGSIPPFHWQPPGFRSFMDAALMSEEVLGVGAGVWGNEIILKPSDVVRASGAVVVNLSDKSRAAPTGNAR
jgi:Cys-tRNA(Pro)/Cys-tRNA(Cys) deacylase